MQQKLRTLFTGRLLLDSFTLAKEFVKLDEYTLQAILENFGVQPSPPSLLSKEDELRNTAPLIKEVAERLQLVPLTFELSRIAGCMWQVSLRQARAERNEMLLMHTFFDKNYLLPDRQKYDKGEGEETAEKGFVGGKVIDPTPGLYDDYVIIVDFNSLYPSIIRHYQICFNSVKRGFRELEKTDREENQPLLHDAETGINCLLIDERQPPILPSILTLLINKRREVRQ